MAARRLTVPVVLPMMGTGMDTYVSHGRLLCSANGSGRSESLKR